MHVIVDIRTTSPQEMIPVRAGIAWARLWKKYKTDDTITLLLHEHQESVEGFTCIHVPHSFLPFSHKPLRSKNTKQIFRCVKFSALPLYDKTIPTIAHIWTNASHLYPEPGQTSLVRRYHDWMRRRTMSQATALIVPDIQIGRELVELYDIREDEVEIIPYLPLSEFSDIPPLQIIMTKFPYFIYDGGYGNEANILTLLAAWERYRHDGGNYELLLLGSAGEHLSTLTQTIRSLELSTSVRYLGVLDEGAMHRIYSGAKGWIYTGPYYSAGVTISQALAYRLPMLLSDIVAFRNYSGIKIHPNHTLDIAERLSRLEIAEYTPSQPHHEQAYIEAYEKIIAKKR